MFYALPAAQSPFEKFTGAWRCNMTDGVFMQREFNLRFSNDNGKLSATVKDAGYTVQELLCVNDSIDLSALYVDKIYHFAGRRDGGKIAGTWKSDDGSSKGTWQAQIDDHQWQFAHTPGLTGLYEYRNSISGAYFYSTDEKIPDSDLQRTKNPVCRVWAVPTNVAAFDFNIKPDNID